MEHKVLVLDDCKSFAEELQKSLSFKNYKIVTCFNSNLAIDASFLEMPGIFICDWQLDSGNNGLVITDILKCICSNLKVLFISAYNSHDLRNNLNSQKNLYFLEKPFCKSRLLEVMTTIEAQNWQDEISLPVAIAAIDKNNQLKAFNHMAQDLCLEKISFKNQKNWQEIAIDQKQYLFNIRQVADSELSFAMIIDKENEMLTRDPKFNYFLTGRPSPKAEENSRMLVIDQHQAIRTLASEIMHENMVFCHTAISIDEGLEILNKDRLIKAVVVDSSFDQKIIKKLILAVREKYIGVKVIGAFASSIPNIAELNFDQVLSKPFSAQNLVQSFYSASNLNLKNEI